MGKRKYRLIIICLSNFLFHSVLISCVLQKKINITNMSIENNKITINLNCKNFAQKINEVIIDNDNDYLVFEKEDIINKITKNTITVELNCTNKTLNTNNEYTLHLRFSGGYAVAKIFIGNPIEKIPDIFPCNDYEKIRIIILEQSSVIGI